MPALGRIYVTPADLGRKVSIRHLVAGVPTDALGELIDWRDENFYVKSKAQIIKAVPFKNIIAAKVVAPEFSAAWVLTKALEVWRAKESENLGDWILQSTGGGAARVNSCLLVGQPNKSIEESLAELIAWYHARELTPIAHLSAPGVFDRALLKCGFEKTHLIDFLYKDVIPAQVEMNFVVESRLSESWFTAVNKNYGPDRSVERFTLESGSWVRFLSLEKFGTIVATARIAGVEDFALITNLYVDETHRGLGIGQELMKAVENIAFEFKMKKIWLQVMHTNQEAQNLYKKLGYLLHHRYQYWAYLQSRV